MTKHLCYAWICLAASTYAMEPSVISADDTAIALYMSAPDATGVLEKIPFTRAQVRRLALPALTLDYGTPSDRQALLDGTALDGIDVPWKTAEVIDLVRTATIEVFDDASARTFVNKTTGDRTCLAYCALAILQFDPDPLEKIERCIVDRLRHDTQFFIQSLATAIIDGDADIPACACSAFAAESARMQEALASSVLVPELITWQCTPDAYVVTDQNGWYLCTKNADGALALYNTNPINLIGKLPPPPGPYGWNSTCWPGANVEFSRDGRWLFVRHWDNERNSWLNVFETQTARQIGRPVRCDTCRISPDGNTVAVSCLNYCNTAKIISTALYNTQTMDEPRPLPPGNVLFAPQSKRLLSIVAGRQYRVTLFDTKTAIHIGDTITCFDYEFSPYDTLLVCQAHGDQPATWLCYGIEAMTQIGDAVTTRTSLFSQDKTLLCANGANRKVRLYSTKNMALIGEPKPGRGFKFSPRGDRLVVLAGGLFNATLVLYNTRYMTSVGSTIPINTEGIEFSPDSQWLWIQNNGVAGSTITLYRAETMEQIGAPVPGDSCICSADGAVLMVESPDTGFGEHKIISYDTSTMQPIEQPAHGKNCCQIHISPNCRLAQIGGDICTIPDMHTLDRFDHRYWGTPFSSTLAIGEKNGTAGALKCIVGRAQQMAAWATIARNKATGTLAEELDRNQGLWSSALDKAPEHLQMFCQDRRA